MASATETCRCGAKISVQADLASSIQFRLEEWRSGHRHAEPRPAEPETAWHLTAVDGR